MSWLIMRPAQSNVNTSSTLMTAARNRDRDFSNGYYQALLRSELYRPTLLFGQHEGPASRSLM